MNNIFYLPINSACLAHYFSRAIILPNNFFTNKLNDIQNNYPSLLLLSKNKWVSNSDCSVEVVLTQIEALKLIDINNSFFLSTVPIPISRVKQIRFLNSDQMRTTIYNINVGTAFIPDRLVSVDEDKSFNSVSDKNFEATYQFDGNIDISDKAKKFDIILGGFAFMKLGRVACMNYSKNYFSTLAYFSKLIEGELKNKKLDYSSKFHGLFNSQVDSEWLKWLHDIYKNLTVEKIQELAVREGKDIKKQYGLIAIDSIELDSHLYELAILATYGEGKSKTVNDLLTDLANKTIPEQKAEEVAIIFGLNNRYSGLRSKYRTANGENDVKFKLDSKLDYYTIESIYQFAFNGIRENTKFQYIDDWLTENKDNKFFNDYETYKIIDTFVISKKKQTYGDFFTKNYLEDFFRAFVTSCSALIPPFLKIELNSAIKFMLDRLDSNSIILVSSLLSKVYQEYRKPIDAETTEVIDFYQKKISELDGKICKLEEEVSTLKSCVLTDKKTGDSLTFVASDVATDTKDAPVPDTLSTSDSAQSSESALASDSSLRGAALSTSDSSTETADFPALDSARETTSIPLSDVTGEISIDLPTDTACTTVCSSSADFDAETTVDVITDEAASIAANSLTDSAIETTVFTLPDLDTERTAVETTGDTIKTATDIAGTTDDVNSKLAMQPIGLYTCAELTNLNLNQLKNVAKQHGVKISGKKDDLINKILKEQDKQPSNSNNLF